MDSCSMTYSKSPHHGIELGFKSKFIYDHVNPVTRRTIDQSAGGKVCDHNAEESWELLKDLALYDNEIKGKEWVKEPGKEENEMETDMEVDEVIEEEESEFETDEEVEEIL
ncbi:hypothetical protein Tco_0777062 [Tanacetum coccineum]